MIGGVLGVSEIRSAKFIVQVLKNKNILQMSEDYKWRRAKTVE